MEIKLNAVVSTVIKTKLPLARVVWLGKDSNNLFLLDLKKVRKICLSTGASKEKIKQIQPFLANVVALSASPTGSILCGLLCYGDVFIWKRHEEEIYLIHNFPDVAFLKSHSEDKNLGNLFANIFVSPDATKLLIVLNASKIYMWHEVTLLTSEKKECWSFIKKNDNVALPSSDYQETSVQAVFVNDPFMGKMCLCSFVFNSQNSICLASVVITSPQQLCLDESYCMCLNSSWKMLHIPLKTLYPAYTPIREQGAVISRYSNNGKILSIVINQYHPYICQLLFLSSCSDAFYLIELNTCNPSQTTLTHSRHNWIADMAWTADDAYVICVTHSSLLCVVSRLGNLIMLVCSGYSLNLGPSYYLPIHQKDLTVLNTSKQNLSMVNNSNAYRYSVSAHPVLPLVLICNGYHIVCLEFPPVTETVDAVRAFLNSSHERIHPIFLYYIHTLPSKYADIFCDVSDTVLQQSLKIPNITGLHELSLEVNRKKSAATSLQPVELEEQQLTEGLKALLSFWGIVASADHPITKELNILCEFAITTFQKAVWILLHSNIDIPTVASFIGISLHQTKEMSEISAHLEPHLPSVFISRLFLKFLNIFYFDKLYFNLLPYILKFALSLIKLVLKSNYSDNKFHLYIVKILFTVLIDVQKVISKVYSFESNFSTSHQILHKRIKMYRSYRPTGLYSEVMNEKEYEQNEESLSGILHKGRKFISTSAEKQLFNLWLLLYNHTANLYSSVQPDDVNDLHEDITVLLCQLQAILQEWTEWPCNYETQKPIKGVVLNIYGNPKKALRWLLDHLPELNAHPFKKQAAHVNSSQSHYLHAILYLCLQEGLLCLAVKFVYGLLNNDIFPIIEFCQTSQHNSYNQNSSSLEVDIRWLAEKLHGLENKVVRNVSKSFVRIFAAYFTNKPVYIYPVHIAKSLPSLLIVQNDMAGRRINILASNITTQLVKEGLENIVTPTIVLELMLLLGMWKESAWFAHQLGNWKIAFLLSVAQDQKHFQESIRCQKDTLQLELHPCDIIKPRLANALMYLNNKADEEFGMPFPTSKEGVYEADSNQVASLRSLLKASVISGLDVTPPMLQEMIKHLKVLILELPLLVSRDVYLPSPYPYCPQSPSMEESSQFDKEDNIRYTMACVVQSMILVLKAANLAIPLVHLYLNFLHSAWKMLGRPVESLNHLYDIFGISLSDKTDLQDIVQNNQPMHSCLLYFRDLCAVLWMTYIRDHLSLACRKLQDSIIFSFAGKSNQAHHSHIVTEALEWAIHLYHFHNFISKESLLQMILNFAAELCPTENIIGLLAKVFNKSNELSSQIQEKFSGLKQLWESYYTEKKSMLQQSLSVNTISMQKDFHDKREDMLNMPLTPGRETKASRHILNITSKSEKKDIRANSPADENLQYINILFNEKCKKENEIFNFLESSPLKINSFLFSDLISSEVDKCYLMHSFELEEAFINFLEIFLHVSFMKHDSNLKYTEDKTPLLKAYQEKLKAKEFSSLSSSFCDFQNKDGISYLFPSPLLTGGGSIIPLSKAAKSLNFTKGHTKNRPHQINAEKHSTLAPQNSPKMKYPSSLSTNKLNGMKKSGISRSEEDISKHPRSLRSHFYGSEMALNLNTHSADKLCRQGIRRNLSTSLNVSKRLFNDQVSLNSESLVSLLNPECKHHIPLLIWLFQWVEKENPTNSIASSPSKLCIQVNITLVQILFTCLLEKHHFKLNKFLNAPSKLIDNRLETKVEYRNKIQGTQEKAHGFQMPLVKELDTVPELKNNASLQDPSIVHSDALTKSNETDTNDKVKPHKLHYLSVNKSKSMTWEKKNKPHLRCSKIHQKDKHFQAGISDGVIKRHNVSWNNNLDYNARILESYPLLPKNPSLLAMTALSPTSEISSRDEDTNTTDENSHCFEELMSNQQLHLLQGDSFLFECQSWYATTGQTISPAMLIHHNLHVPLTTLSTNGGYCTDDTVNKEASAIFQEFNYNNVTNRNAKQKETEIKTDFDPILRIHEDTSQNENDFPVTLTTTLTSAIPCKSSYDDNQNSALSALGKNKLQIQKQEISVITETDDSQQLISSVSSQQLSLNALTNDPLNMDQVGNHIKDEKSLKLSENATNPISNKQATASSQISISHSHKKEPVIFGSNKNSLSYSSGSQTLTYTVARGLAYGNQLPNKVTDTQRIREKPLSVKCKNYNSSQNSQDSENFMTHTDRTLYLKSDVDKHSVSEKKLIHNSSDEHSAITSNIQNNTELCNLPLRGTHTQGRYLMDNLVFKNQHNSSSLLHGLPLIQVNDKCIPSSQENSLKDLFIGSTTSIPLKSQDKNHSSISCDITSQAVDASESKAYFSGKPLQHKNLKIQSKPKCFTEHQLLDIANHSYKLQSFTDNILKTSCTESNSQKRPFLCLQEKQYKPCLLTLKQKTLPTLISPEKIIAYKKKKRREEIVKLYDSLKSSYQTSPQSKNKIKLLEVPSHFEPEDARSNPKRQKRRQALQKQSKSEDENTKR